MTRQEAIKYINTLSNEVDLEVTITNIYVSSGQVEKLGMSRQLLKYHVKAGNIRTIPCGKQKKYLLDDVKKMLKN